MKIVYLFSGQGSQYTGMGEELLNLYPEINEIYSCGSDILGFDLKSACFTYPDEQLAQTRVSQPAIMATSLAALFAAKQNGITAQAVAGHSLGEYGAMIASGMLSLEDGFKVIKSRADAMQKCACNQAGSMYAVIGATTEEILEVCQSVDGYVEPVNYNSPSQTVIAGEESATATAAAKFSEIGKRAIKLNVTAAFHSKLMQPASDEFLQAIKDVKFNPPKLDFYRNITGEKLTDMQNIRESLAAHISSPVKFTDELNAMNADGFNAFVELGPNKVLTGLVKKTLKGLTAVNIENEKTLLKAVEAVN